MHTLSGGLAVRPRIGQNAVLLCFALDRDTQTKAETDCGEWVVSCNILNDKAKELCLRSVGPHLAVNPSSLKAPPFQEASCGIRRNYGQ